MKIDMSKYREDWVEIDGAKYLLQPFPYSGFKMPKKDEDNDFVVTMEEGWIRFDKCLLGWQELFDENDKPVPFNKKNKKYIFDHITEVREPIMAKIKELDQYQEEEVKN